MSLEIGQRIQVDLFGMRLGGLPPTAQGTVVGLGPGVIVVQVPREEGAPLEVTVSPGRIER